MGTQPLDGMLVVDFSRYLPGAFASRELLELGARVVCVEPPDEDPMRSSAPAWDAALRKVSASVRIQTHGNGDPTLTAENPFPLLVSRYRPRHRRSVRS
jgi:alpha-methylacyl-CoA racemase